MCLGMLDRAKCTCVFRIQASVKHHGPTQESSARNTLDSLHVSISVDFWSSSIQKCFAVVKAFKTPMFHSATPSEVVSHRKRSWALDHTVENLESPGLLAPSILSAGRSSLSSYQARVLRTHCGWASKSNLCLPGTNFDAWVSLLPPVVSQLVWNLGRKRIL